MQNTVDVRSQICSKGVSIFNRYACWLVVSDQNQGDMLGERGQDFGYHDGMDCSQLYSACLFRMHIYQIRNWRCMEKKWAGNLEKPDYFGEI